MQADKSSFFGLSLSTLFKWAFWLCATAVLALALIAKPPESISTGWDKANHLLAFFTLGILARLAFSKSLATLAGALLFYGGLIEILQSFAPNRSAEWVDLLADATGIAIGFGLYWLGRRLVLKC